MILSLLEFLSEFFQMTLFGLSENLVLLYIYDNVIISLNEYKYTTVAGTNTDAHHGHIFFNLEFKWTAKSLFLRQKAFQYP